MRVLRGERGSPVGVASRSGANPSRSDGERSAATPPTPFRSEKLIRLLATATALPGGFAFPRFHRLAKAVSFAVHLENMTAVRQAIQKRGRHTLALEHLAPVAECQVAGDEQTL